MREIFASVCPPDAMIEAQQLKMRDKGYCSDSREAGLLLRPDTTDMVADICRTANERGIGLVPQGGLTGLVDGTAAQPDQVAVSLERMTHILRIDPDQQIVAVQAGATLQSVNEALEPLGLMTGIDIPSRGSCTIGGLVATNAGGVRVIRYGMTSDNVLGLKVVLADGTVIDEMNTLMKNNTGYNLKQLFIGSEGTLGIVTEAVLKLHPRPAATACALLECSDLDAALGLLQMARRLLSGNLLAFEAMWPEYYRLTSGFVCADRPPLPAGEGLYILIEASGHDEEDAGEKLLSLFEAAAGEDFVKDGVVAKSIAEKAVIWNIREDSDLVAKSHGSMLSYDVSIQTARIATFIEHWQAALAVRFPAIPSFIFGHLGDGNLHVCLSVTSHQKRDRAEIDNVFYDVVRSIPGSSISAEHGIGLGKRQQLARSRSAVALNLMYQIKNSLDPVGIMNPGKVLA